MVRGGRERGRGREGKREEGVGVHGLQDSMVVPSTSIGQTPCQTDLHSSTKTLSYNCAGEDLLKLWDILIGHWVTMVTHVAT